MSKIMQARFVKAGWTVRFAGRDEKVTSNQPGPRGLRKIRTDHCDHNVPAASGVTVVAQDAPAPFSWDLLPR